MSKDILMPCIPLFRIKDALSQGLAEERIKPSLDNRGGRQGLMDQDPLSTHTCTYAQICKVSHTDSAAHLNAT